MKYKLVLLFLVTTGILFSQSEPGKQINLLMAQLRSGQAITADRGKILSSTSYREATDALGKYVSDTVLSVRFEALNLFAQVATKSKDKVLINKAIRHIVTNAVINKSINNQIVNLLKRNIKADFGNDELQLMKSLLESEENNIGNLARIYAFAAGPTALNDLRPLLAKPTLTKGDKKDIKLALVRSGDEAYAQKMNETLKQQVVNDELIYSALPEILYTKDRTMFAFLLNAIQSDNKKCSSANNDDATPIICAYRLIEQLAPQIINFPVSINDRGEINTKDLNKSLVEVRDWITKHKDSFEVRNDVY